MKKEITEKDINDFLIEVFSYPDGSPLPEFSHGKVLDELKRNINHEKETDEERY